LISSAAIANVFQFILYLIVAKKRISPRLWNAKLLRSMLKYSIPLLPAVLAFWIVSLSSTYILVRYSSMAEVGIYGIGTRSAGVISMLTGAVYMAYTVYAFQTVKEEGAQRKFVSILDVFFLVVACLCFTAAMFGPEIIGIMADASYSSAARLLVPLMFSQLAYGISTMAGYGMAFVKKSSLTTVAVLAGAAVSLSLNLILIPRIGALGAAWSSLASYGVIAAFTVWFAERVYPCGYHIWRIACCFGVLVALAQISQDAALQIKALSEAAGIVFVCVAFRDVLGQIGTIARGLLQR
ncbi:MAG: polysaccharide biosynthesis C-terminal domain-containing protein, partial [Actinomycetia bacterium]|nr:polysaccharide biosynthesis C-terminal domain-containing protein [Actinomycetes bacterium]